MIITLDEMIKCVGREVGMRKDVYPRWVAQKKMTQEKASKEIECMKSVLNFLVDIKDKQE